MSPKDRFAALEPLKELLGEVVARLEALEAKAGLVPPIATTAPLPKPVPSSVVGTIRKKNVGVKKKGS